MPQAIETRLLFRNDARTPLGRLTMAGFIRNSAGVGGAAMRVLGSYAIVLLLEAELTQDIDLRAIAGAVGIPYETFRKRFQQLIGVAPARYRAIRRIDAACAMLQQPGPTTRAIADSLGFSDEFHFSRRFKQITGMSPREFRRLLPHAAESPE